MLYDCRRGFVVSDLYFVGSVAQVYVNIAEIDGTPADPGGLLLRVKAPNGAMIVLDYQAAEILRDRVGTFHADLTCDVAGIWAWRWELSAPNAGAIEGVFRVQRSGVI